VASSFDPAAVCCRATIMRLMSGVVSDVAWIFCCECQVSMTWPEVWHEGLEEASRMYFGDGNVEGMLQRLQVLFPIAGLAPF